MIKRPPFAMIFAAGFAEAGPEGEGLQARLREIVRDNGVFLLGPNTTLNSFLPLRADLAGKRLALISHSGHQGRHLWQGQDIGIPMAYWAPTGNEVDLEFADFVNYFAGQPSVGAIAGYVEGFKDGPKLRLAAEEALATGVPLVLIKVGPDRAGRVRGHVPHRPSRRLRRGRLGGAASSTASPGSTAWTSCSTPRPCWPAARPPLADGVCIYSISGGTLAHLTDPLAAAAGLSVPELLDVATQQQLREWIPGYLRVNNPVDSGGGPSVDWRGRRSSWRPSWPTPTSAWWCARSWPTPTT